MVPEIGRRLPATCLGVGKAILASLPPGEAEALYPTDADLAIMKPHRVSSREALARG